MKKRIIIISVILAILVLVSITGLYLYNKNMTYNLTIIEKFWNVSGEQYHNEKLKFNIKLSDEIKVNGGLNDEITFKVVKVNKDSISIRTSEEMSQLKNDSLQMEDEFIIKMNEEIALNRMTMGSGVSYTIKLER